MSFFLALLVAIAFASLMLGILVYFTNPKNSADRTFAIFSFIVVLWIISNYLVDFPIKKELAIFWNRLNFSSAIMMSTVIFYFSFVFPKKSIMPKFLASIYFIVNFLILAIILFTGFGIKSIQFFDWGTNATPGPLFYFAIVLAALNIIGLFINIAIKYKKSDASEKIQIKYFIYGIALSLAISLSTNAFLPILIGTYEYAKYGPASMIFMLGFIAYAIIKHHLFNIRVIVTEIGVAIINFILLVQVFLSKSWGDGIVRSIFLLIVLYGSYILVQSVNREIKQKEEIQKLANDLKDANEHLKELDELKDDFLSMAAHELNTPLAAISGYLSMILDEHIGGEVNPKIKKYLENMFTSSKRLSLLVKDMLNVSRIESGRIHLIYADTPIESVIEQAIAEIGSKAKERNQSLIYHKAKTKMPHTWFDASRVTEVLINIIGNAIKYTDSNGKIEVFIKNDDKFITVSIKDNGRGIPKDKIDTVFEKFAQVDILKDEIKGTGLGMYISKKFIELLGGRIWFDSEEGKGSTFYFTLPILKDKPHDPHEGEGEVLH